ncbi:SPOR domain-containing protein [Pseudothermotoga thermarum]|uniref:Sporulation domain-containing protein n=1 Tax=Pseudothermotoga thermarum DSM 5069 TaxID=688269 RepID=F7YU90_9THEM|nr:SPOR domain-containing protein [Pseudothermotoga thermarum]AEH50188.1 Sporulation domain-containing protein [Pseudothermotoga thermarum DSM 5069]
MARNQIKLTDIQARILAILIIVLSVGFVAFSLATFILVQTRRNVKVEVIELPPPRVETPSAELKTAEKIETVQAPVYKVEVFDYKKLLVESVEVVERGAVVSVYVVEPEDALKIIRGSNLPFLIHQYDDKTYTVCVLGDYKYSDLSPFRTLYGVLVFSTTNFEAALQRVIAFRSAGYSAYLMKFQREGRTWYSLVLGVFADLSSAETYNSKLNWNEVMKLAGSTRPGYVGRISP